jgi:Uncharacterised nucleotidyltransferase
VKRSLLETVVDFLGFHANAARYLPYIKQFSARQWKACLPWLHDSGLALYFIQKLNDHSALDSIPCAVAKGLQVNLRSNKERTDYLSAQLRSVNRAFDDSGVNYATVKGFSLVPEFCPDIALRPLGDLDYLVDRESLCAARKAILQQGYSGSRTTATESVFLSLRDGHLHKLEDQYSRQTPHQVELHLSLWDPNEHGVVLAEPVFSVKKVQSRFLPGLSFHALSWEEIFLLQAIHAFHHILGGWMRMSWIYEIGYFLNTRKDDNVFWTNIADQVGNDATLREVVAVVGALSALFFAAPLPPPISAWIRGMRSAVKLWIDNFASPWMFGRNHPGGFDLLSPAKLVLFLQQQYLPAGRNFVPSRLVGEKGLSRMLKEIRSTPATLLNSDWCRHQLITRKMAFHVGANIRYVWEARRWRRLTSAVATEINRCCVEHR